MITEFNDNHKKQINQYYSNLKNYFNITGVNHPDRSKTPRALKARSKLLKLSNIQFFELCTDISDELNRRITEVQNKPDYLLPKSNFHLKRNQARQKLSNLSTVRFNDLIDDIIYEIERRGYFNNYIDENSSKTDTITNKDINTNNTGNETHKYGNLIYNIDKQDKNNNDYKFEKDNNNKKNINNDIDDDLNFSNENFDKNFTKMSNNQLPVSKENQLDQTDLEFTSSPKNEENEVEPVDTKKSSENESKLQPINSDVQNDFKHIKDLTDKEADIKPQTLVIDDGINDNNKTRLIMSNEHNAISPGPKQNNIQPSLIIPKKASIDWTSSEDEAFDPKNAENNESDNNEDTIDNIENRTDDVNPMNSTNELDNSKLVSLTISEKNDLTEQDPVDEVKPPSSEHSIPVATSTTTVTTLIEQNTSKDSSSPDKHNTLIARNASSSSNESINSVKIVPVESSNKEIINSPGNKNSELLSINSKTTDISDPQNNSISNVGMDSSLSIGIDSPLTEKTISVIINKTTNAGRQEFQVPILVDSPTKSAKKTNSTHLQNELMSLNQQLGDMAIENERLKQKLSETELKQRHELKKLRNSHKSKSSLSLVSTSPTIDNDIFNIELLKEFISKEGMLPFTVVQELYELTNQIYEYIIQNAAKLIDNNKFGKYLFVLVSSISKNIKSILDLLNNRRNEYKDQIVLLKASLSHMITSIRYYALYHHLIPKIVILSTISELVFTVTEVVELVKIHSSTSTNQSHQTKSSSIHSQSVVQELKLNKQNNFTDLKPPSAGLSSSIENSPVKPLKIIEKVSNSPKLIPTTYKDHSRKFSSSSLLNVVKDSKIPKSRTKLSVPPVMTPLALSSGNTDNTDVDASENKQIQDSNTVLNHLNENVIASKQARFHKANGEKNESDSDQFDTALSEMSQFPVSEQSLNASFENFKPSERFIKPSTQQELDKSLKVPSSYEQNKEATQKPSIRNVAAQLAEDRDKNVAPQLVEDRDDSRELKPRFTNNNVSAEKVTTDFSEHNVGELFDGNPELHADTTDHYSHFGSYSGSSSPIAQSFGIIDRRPSENIVNEDLSILNGIPMQKPPSIQDEQISSRVSSGTDDLINDLDQSIEEFTNHISPNVEEPAIVIDNETSFNAELSSNESGNAGLNIPSQVPEIETQKNITEEAHLLEAQEEQKSKPDIASRDIQSTKSSRDDVRNESFFSKISKSFRHEKNQETSEPAQKKILQNNTSNTTEVLETKPTEVDSMENHSDEFKPDALNANKLFNNISKMTNNDQTSLSSSSSTFDSESDHKEVITSFKRDLQSKPSSIKVGSGTLETNDSSSTAKPLVEQTSNLGVSQIPEKLNTTHSGEESTKRYKTIKISKIESSSLQKVNLSSENKGLGLTMNGNEGLQKKENVTLFNFNAEELNSHAPAPRLNSSSSHLQKKTQMKTNHQTQEQPVKTVTENAEHDDDADKVVIRGFNMKHDSNADPVISNADPEPKISNAARSTPPLNIFKARTTAAASNRLNGKPSVSSAQTATIQFNNDLDNSGTANLVNSPHDTGNFEAKRNTSNSSELIDDSHEIAPSQRDFNKESNSNNNNVVDESVSLDSKNVVNTKRVDITSSSKDDSNASHLEQKWDKHETETKEDDSENDDSEGDTEESDSEEEEETETESESEQEDEDDFDVNAFDIENPDNSLSQLLLYLEHQTVQVITTIQSLLSSIKEPKSTQGNLRAESNAINQVINQMTGATSVSMNQSRNANLKEHGSWVVQSLNDCSRRMVILCQLDKDGVLQTQKHDSDYADKNFKQRLAGIAFDIAKCTKELVKTVEEASLKEEIEFLNSKIR